MPWTCLKCQLELPDDESACPECATHKTAWTVVAEQTRALTLSGRAKLQVLRGTGPRPRASAVGAEDERVAAEVAPVLPKPMLAQLLDDGLLPAPAQTLIARVWPRRAKDWTVTLTIEFAQSEAGETDWPQDDAALDADGAFEVPFVCVAGPGPADGLRARLAERGLRLLDVSEAGDPGHAPELEVAAVKKSVNLPTSLVAGPDAVELLEVEDVSFQTGRSVLLPAGWSDADPITGLSVIAAALEHARRHPERALCVAGHTDAVGSDAANLALSAERAENVLLYLRGDRAGWAADCQARHDLADVQAILAWVAALRGWPCHPGPIDGAWGPKTRDARDAFRSRYAAATGASLPAGDLAEADWEAFAALYDEAVAEKLKTDVARVAALREGLRFTTPASLACGEQWPSQRERETPLQDPDAKDRRVDLLFLDAGAIADLDLAAEPAGAPVYGPDGFQRIHLEVDDALREPEPPPPSDAPFAADCLYRPLHGAAAGA